MNNPDILIAKEQLKQNNIVIAMVKDGEILFTSSKKGIQPFFDALAEIPRESFFGCSIADRVVGKAALMLAAYIGAKDVYTPLASQHAQAFAKAYIYAEASMHRSAGRLVLITDKIVPFIINRTQDGMCPMESAVLNIDDPEEAYNILKHTLQKLKNM